MELNAPADTLFRAKRRLICACSAAMTLAACGSGLEGDKADEHLTSAVFLPDEGELLENPETDTSIVINGDGSGGAPTAVMAGEMLSVSIPFSAPNGNVVGVGLRFGDTGPIRTIPIPGAMGQTSGRLQFDMQVPPSVCDDLSKICHDIKCYEFAVTDAGRVSRANINSVAVACGNCDEPSCADLLMCDDLMCNGTTTVCPGARVDFCLSSTASRCEYRVGSQRFDCGDCQDPASLQDCATRATQAALAVCS